jgi:hypothetical protein
LIIRCGSAPAAAQDDGWRTMFDFGCWMLDFGLWIMDYGLWIMDFELFFKFIYISVIVEMIKIFLPKQI